MNERFATVGFEKLTPTENHFPGFDMSRNRENGSLRCGFLQITARKPGVHEK